MIKKILLFTIISFGYCLKAQETLPIYQQYLLDGKYLINPAFYGNTDYFVVNGNYQKQFSKFAESPNVQSIGIHDNIFDRVGAGLVVFNDKNGPISSNGITAGASYFIPLSDEGDRKDQFSFGTNVNFYNMTFDYSLLNPQDPNDPILNEGNNNIFIAYANFGLQSTYHNFFGGISVLDVALSNDIPIVNGIEPSPTKILLNAGYDWNFTEGISLEPSLLINLNTNSTKMVDFNLMAKVFNETNMFAAGVSYRTASDKNGGQQLSLSPILKMQFGQFTFGAAYNLGMSGVQTYGGNSFMLSIGYNFQNFVNPRGFRYR